jgi:Domain of unknown function (DUF4372)/Transposase DDE domain
MDPGKLVFAQLMEFVPRHDFDACVRRYGGDRRPRGFSCRDQFFCMTFAQLTFRESLRDIETCPRALEPKLYHAGFRSKISRSTLADANRVHDWRIFSDFAQVLIGRAQKLCVEGPFGVELEQTVYALDSTTIDLCLSLLPWAKSRRRNGAVKLHTLLDLRGNIPTLMRITHGKTHDVTVLDHLPIEPGAFYVMDRGYVDFRRIHRFTTCSAYFVTRAKRGLDFTRRSRRRVDKTTGLRSGQTIVLARPKTSRLYPDPLRRIVFYDAENDRRFVFLTNNFTLPALTIAKIYRSRWQVDLFFKWIKQNLHIKSFYGTTDNAVRTQVWIAIGVYVLAAIVRKELRIERGVSEILQILSLTLFEKAPIFQALSASKSQDPELPCSNQLSPFDL